MQHWSYFTCNDENDAQYSVEYELNPVFPLPAKFAEFSPAFAYLCSLSYLRMIHISQAQISQAPVILSKPPHSMKSGQFS